MNIHDLLNATVVIPGVSVAHQVKDIKFVGFENHLTPKKAIKSALGMQYVYRIHVLEREDEPLSVLTGKKVGRCRNMVSRRGLYRQHFREGVPDRCPFNRMLIQCLQENPDRHVWLAMEFLEWDEEAYVKKERETHWKKVSMAEGYKLLSN